MSNRPVHVEVRLKPGESADRLIKRFLKKVKKEKILRLYADKQFYKKPSTKRREKKKRRLQMIRKLQREMNKY